MVKLAIVLLLLIQAPCFSLFGQDSLILEKIDYETESVEIKSFIHAFISTSDSISIQKYIQFPWLFVSPPEQHSFRLLNQNSSAEEIRQIADSENCHYPLYYYQLLYHNNLDFQTEVDNQGVSLEEYFYKNSLNRNAMCGYLINQYRFPFSVKLLTTVPYYFTNVIFKNYYPESSKIIALRIDSLIFGIIKVNHNYKVFHVGYFSGEF